MGDFCADLENGILDHIFQNGALTITAPVEIALWVGAPGNNALTGVEASYAGYSRATIAFDAAASGLINQTADVEFGLCSDAGQADIDYWVIFDSTATPLALAWGTITGGPVTVANGNTPSIAAGQCDISLGNTSMSDYLRNAILNFVFRGVAFTAPTISVAFTSTILAATDTTLVGKEIPATNGYARELVAAWSAAVAGTLDNDAEILFGPPTGDWDSGSAIVASAIMDTNTHNAGNMLFYDNGIVDNSVASGDTVHYIAGAFDVTIT